MPLHEKKLAIKRNYSFTSISLRVHSQSMTKVELGEVFSCWSNVSRLRFDQHLSRLRFDQHVSQDHL